MDSDFNRKMEVLVNHDFFVALGITDNRRLYKMYQTMEISKE